MYDSLGAARSTRSTHPVRRPRGLVHLSSPALGLVFVRHPLIVQPVGVTKGHRQFEHHCLRQRRPPPAQACRAGQAAGNGGSQTREPDMYDRLGAARSTRSAHPVRRPRGLVHLSSPALGLVFVRHPLIVQPVSVTKGHRQFEHHCLRQWRPPPAQACRAGQAAGNDDSPECARFAGAGS